ncbi:MAG: 23S rRNA (guanosine(2251)-2'-O)-methyltransferase RlmB [Calditrichaeota bacterium]|nr:MAG: 23S rRNA (guanosine(2251)-2'-O)-methyltransferase RlmB [Calditrichota bacterium]
MSEIIYGRKPVLEVLRSGKKIEKILIDKNLSRSKINEILTQAKKLQIPVEKISAKLLFKITGIEKNQGVAAIIPSFEYASLSDILAISVKRQEPHFLALLDGIEDPHNLGAIIRSAEGAGVHGIIIPERRAVGVTATVAKTSAGALAYVPVAQVSNLNYTIDSLKKQNIWIIGADQNAQQIYYEADFTLPLGIVIGSEGKGLHRLVKEKCDFLVKIPMYGQVNSLNASVAAALLFFEVRRQRSLKI